MSSMSAPKKRARERSLRAACITRTPSWELVPSDTEAFAADFTFAGLRCNRSCSQVNLVGPAQVQNSPELAVHPKSLPWGGGGRFALCHGRGLEGGPERKELGDSLGKGSFRKDSLNARPRGGREWERERVNPLRFISRSLCLAAVW